MRDFTKIWNYTVIPNFGDTEIPLTHRLWKRACNKTIMNETSNSLKWHIHINSQTIKNTTIF